LTISGDLVGTLRYMSPEQALARHGLVDHRTDVYALGATLYELLTGKPVVTGDDKQEILRQITFEEPVAPRKVLPSLPADLDVILLKALEKNPTDRYATAQEFADDLRRFVDEKPIQAKRPSLAQRATKWARRHKALVRMAIAGLFVALITFAVATVLIWDQKNRKDFAVEQAKINFARSEANRKTAEANYREAERLREAAQETVERMYVNVGEKWLANRPGMTHLQKVFIGETLVFYEKFARENTSVR